MLATANTHPNGDQRFVISQIWPQLSEYILSFFSLSIWFQLSLTRFLLLFHRIMQFVFVILNSPFQLVVGFINFQCIPTCDKLLLVERASDSQKAKTFQQQSAVATKEIVNHSVALRDIAFYRFQLNFIVLLCYEHK